MKTEKIKQPLEDWLEYVDYSFLNSTDYVPTVFAMEFMTFIKLVNGEQGESNKTPPVHLAMLDKLAESTQDYLVNLLFRGAAKTTLFMEYMTLYLAVFGYLPGHGKVEAMIYVSDSMENGVKNARKNIEFRYNNSPFLQRWIKKATFTDPYLEFESVDGHKLGVKMFGAQTGIRGSKIFGKRPTFCVLDDLIGDGDANSKAAMDAIKNTVYNGVNHALDPTRRKIVFNGTPFNKEDVIVEAVESGEWHVNVYPVCEKFPCTREEFRGAWEDRFTYDFIDSQYKLALGTGKVAGFMQELMLRVTSEEERLVQDAEIKWYSRAKLLEAKDSFNFYITTDFATSKKTTADYSVISVWAVNHNGDWFWVDGFAKRTTMDESINMLFKFVQAYSPQQVGIEVSGQQTAFITWLQTEMMHRRVWFNFASNSKSGDPGIRPSTDKLTRFNLVVPWFKAGKMYFPEELKSSVIMGLFMGQIRLVTQSGIKGKDDCIDTISMLGYFKPWLPSESAPATPDEVDRWEHDQAPDNELPINSYVV